MTCVDSLDTAAPESRIAWWQPGRDRLAPRVEPLPRGGRCSLRVRPPVRMATSSQAARVWHTPGRDTPWSGTSAGPQCQAPPLSPGGWRLSARRQHRRGGPPALTPRRASSANPRRAPASSGVHRASRARCGRERSAPWRAGHPGFARGEALSRGVAALQGAGAQGAGLNQVRAVPDAAIHHHRTLPLHRGDDCGSRATRLPRRHAGIRHAGKPRPLPRRHPRHGARRPR